jgi:transcription-repair coupling factor (superfamily II helicase)
MAVRLDYFGDEIDSIYEIDTETMGSGRALARVQVIGASVQRLQSDERTTSLLELIPADTVVVLSEVMELAEQARGYYERLTAARGVYAPAMVLKALIERPHVEINQYSMAADPSQAIALPVAVLPTFHQDAPSAVAELTALAAGEAPELGEMGQGRPQVIVLCEKPAEQQRLAELLHERAPGSEQLVQIEAGYLHRGLIWQDTRGAGSIVLVPHHELFHRYATRRQVRRIGSAALAGGDRATDAFVDLEPGDYVVHTDHGVGRYVGMRTMRRGGVSEEFLTLEFANQALLHVPVAEIELVQKYIGGFQGKPPLSMLGGNRWARQMQQAAEAVRDLAGQMLRVQAARAALPGFRFPVDTPWQHEFEAEFPYEETDDQLAAITEVKKDMSDSQPMDRLICGDVGFGKTEVAIRAAFKAVETGKQVAVLVPTTVLAEQHERTFRERMADYPFRVESISRFKTGLEQKKLLTDLAGGQVDVIIGTHRLLSPDVVFPDLGLVVIDEEQRFGVEHKQVLLQLRMTVDVLTLTATPIPRTLHMALLGLRDISSLSQAPRDRRAVVTEVVPFERERVRRAIARELARDGQVYFVHNKVHDIMAVAEQVQALAPGARIVVGHGQMAGHELEKVMLAFLRREADILVCTTIIESGLDIPTANTIFIDEADHYGLADLHQLRGRVGRWKNRAYCYLLLPGERPVTDKAAKRLQAVEQYSMLGAGFKIAMRDLEIRGAGNLLGAEQSGHIAAVGYQMYCTLLEQEARKLKADATPEPLATHLELSTPGAPISGRVPPGYIASEKHRMQAYRRISRAAALEELSGVAQDLKDAYGKPPAALVTLLDLAEIRIAAGSLGIEAIKREGPDVIFRTANPQALDPLLRNAPGRTSLIDDKTIYYRPPANYLVPGTLLAVLRKLLVPAKDRAAEAGAGGKRRAGVKLA